MRLCSGFKNLQDVIEEYVVMWSESYIQTFFGHLGAEKQEQARLMRDVRVNQNNIHCHI